MRPDTRCQNPPIGGPASDGRNDPMAIDWWRTELLNQAPSDPKRYSARDKKKAVAIVRHHGVRLPLVIAPDGSVLAGFVAVLAARELGIEQLPVLVADDLPEPQLRLLSLALNRFCELGEFDDEALGALVIDLEVSIPDLDPESFGFEVAEIDIAIDAAKGRKPAKPEVAPPDGPPVTVPGDIWLLGDHRVGCGDAADPASYAALLAGEKAGMVFTDPPYGCPVKGFVSTRDHREFVQGSGELDGEALTAFFSSWCRCIVDVTEPGAIVELCIDWRSMPRLLAAAGETFGGLVNLAVWVKDRAGMGSFLRSQHELVLIYRVPGAQHRNNVELGRHGRSRTNVWSYPSAMTFSRNGDEGDLLASHPTPKPRELVADAILDCTKRRAIVLDPFLGSGTTLVAAEKTGRRCVGFDLDPLYVDFAIRRWQVMSERKAVHAVTGLAFDAAAQSNLTKGAETHVEG